MKLKYIKTSRLLKSRNSNSKNPSSLHYEDSLLKFFPCLALKPSRHLLFQASKVLRILPSAIKYSLHVVYNLSSVFSFMLTHKLWCRNVALHLQLSVTDVSSIFTLRYNFFFSFHIELPWGLCCCLLFLNVAILVVWWETQILASKRLNVREILESEIAVC